MNQFFQESDKIMLNQFSVHRFYLEIIEEMEKIVTSHRQSGYMLDWDQRTAVTFMQVPSLLVVGGQVLYESTARDIHPNQIEVPP